MQAAVHLKSFRELAVHMYTFGMITIRNIIYLDYIPIEFSLSPPLRAIDGRAVNYKLTVQISGSS